MKKILLGLLIVASLSACTSSEKKMDMSAEVKMLEETIYDQKCDYEDYRKEAKELEAQMHSLRKEIKNTTDSKNN